MLLDFIRHCTEYFGANISYRIDLKMYRMDVWSSDAINTPKFILEFFWKIKTWSLDKYSFLLQKFVLLEIVDFSDGW